MKFSEHQLQRWHGQVFGNFNKIHFAETCRCFHCLESFPGIKVTRCTDRDETAKCPYCCIDSVIHFELPEGALEAMHEKYFKE